MNEGLSEAKSIFRENALKRLNLYEEANGILRIIDPSDWLAILVFLIMMVAILIWCIAGQIDMNVKAIGIVMPTNQIERSEDLVQKDKNSRAAVLRSMSELLAKKRGLYEKHYLTLVDLQRAETEYLAAVEELSHAPSLSDMTYRSESNENKDTQPLEALVFINHSEGKKIKIGMTGYVIPRGGSIFEYAYTLAKVKSISNYPVSKEYVYSLLGNMSLVDEFFSQGSPFLVRMSLEKNMGSALSPYINTGSAISAKIIYLTISPLNLILHINHQK
jgi:hypothetical protein